MPVALIRNRPFLHIVVADRQFVAVGGHTDHLLCVGHFGRHEENIFDTMGARNINPAQVCHTQISAQAAGGTGQNCDLFHVLSFQNGVSHLSTDFLAAFF